MSSNIENILPAIRQAVKDIISEEITPRLNNLELKLSELADMKVTLGNHKKRLDDYEKSLKFTGDQLNDVITKRLPELDTKFTDLTQNICMNMLDLENHRRKWSIIVNGLKGPKGEEELTTRANVKKFAKEHLKVEGADLHRISACHRLDQKEDAGIIVRFCDLSERNSWLSNAKNLKASPLRVSISPDLPPSLRPLKADILKQRKELPPEVKRISQVRYLPSWPYVILKIRNKPTKIPRVQKRDIIQSYLDHVN